MSAIAAVTMTMVGCASTEPRVDTSDPAVKELIATANRIHESLGKLAILEQGAIQDPHTYGMPLHGPLATPITMDWRGPIEPALRTIAGLIGYGFQSLGTPPTNPMVVRAVASQRPAFLVLEDIGWQAGDNALVIVDNDHRQIQISYVGHQ